MTEAEIKVIMSDIHKILIFSRILDDIEKDLRRINTKLDDLASLPSSGNFDKVKVENNHVELSTKINNLLSDEQELIERKSRISERLELALSYKRQILAQTDNDLFMVDYMNGMSYRKMTIKHGYENPYEHMISVMRNLTIRI